MDQPRIYIPISTPALSFAAGILRQSGILPAGCAEDADYLLYPSPTPLNAMEDYCHGATVIGGNLDFLNSCVPRIDLLKDPYYLAHNAAITAEAALGLILSRMPCAITDGEILILGWGRIGKCLTHQLAHLNAPLSVFARRPEDRAMLRALGYTPIDPESLSGALSRFRCIVNTVPAPVLSQADEQQISEDCYKLDLASVCCLPGSNVHHAKGLPGKYKPESSGKLIANTILYHIGGEKT